MSVENPSEKNTETNGTLAANALLRKTPKIINVGLDGFADDLTGQGVSVVRVAWSPPAGGDAKLAALLAKLGV